MKRWISCSLTILLWATAFPQQAYQWVAPEGEWAIPGNWLPERTAPHPGDTLVFSGNALVSALPAEENVGYVFFSMGSSIRMEAAANSRIICSGAGPLVLKIEAGAVVSLSGDGGLEWHIAPEKRAEVWGEISCTEGPHRLFALGNGKIHFENKALFKAGTGFTGNPFGTSVFNSVYFHAGATYTSIAGANPFGAAAPNSVLVFETGSTYRHQRATAPQMSGRVYGNFEVAAAASYNISLPQDVVVQNDLVLSSGQFLFKPSAGAGHFKLGGGIRQTGTGTLQLGHAAWPGQVQLTGTNTHIFLANNQQAVSIHQLSMKGGDLVLERPLHITGHLLLENGMVYSSDTALLTLKAGASLSSSTSLYHHLPAPFSAHAASFVNGPLHLEGLLDTDTCVLPVGGNGHPRPLHITHQTGSITATYFSGSPASLGAPTPGDSLVHISAGEYWRISGLQPQAELQLSFLHPISGAVTDLAHLRVSRLENGAWTNLGNTGATGFPGSNGAVKAVVPGDGYFTLASIHPASTLPAHSGKLEWRIRGNLIDMSWQPIENEEVDNYYWYVSPDGKQWQPWGTGTTAGNAGSTHCTATGALGNLPNPYFKLVRFFRDGQTSSHTTRITYQPEIPVVVYPNPANEKIFIFFTNSSSKTKIDIVSITGTVVQMAEMNGEKTEIDIRRLKQGLYFLHLRNKNNYRILPFLKQ